MTQTAQTTTAAQQDGRQTPAADDGTSEASAEQDRSDLPLAELDDELDSEELRTRYHTLLQELRVLLPGVQVLVAFMLTAPFAQGFAEVDDLGRRLYGAALVSGMLAIVSFIAPTAFHRVGPRRARVARLQWAIRTTRAGLVCMSIAFEAALLVVLSVVFSYPVAVACVVLLAVAAAGVWLVVPKTMGSD